MVIFMIGMFFLLVMMKAVETTNMYRYPATINCEAIGALFDSSA